MVLDVAGTVFAFTGALALRFDAPGPVFEEHLRELAWIIPLLVVCRIASFLGFRLYQRVWRYASIDELLAVIGAVSVSSLVAFPIAFLLVGALGWPAVIPRSLPVIEGILAVGFLGSWRFWFRVAGVRRAGTSAQSGQERALVVGSGAAAIGVIRELRHGSTVVPFHLVGVVADDLANGQRLMGLPIVGSSGELGEIISKERISVVLLALPSATGRQLRQLVASAEARGARCLTVPGIAEVAAGRVTLNALREIDVEDLLRRAPARIDTETVANYFRDKVVLITGAGGSIGSELARQLLPFQPAHLVLVGRGENSIFEVVATLGSTSTRITPVVLDVRDRSGMAAVLREVRPAVVFHAAAHKHVPLMERQPEEALATNAIATLHLLETCAETGVDRFVLISSDKAVNPSSVMGATKRIAELAVTDIARRYGRSFVSVRFGNVLSSRGSVVPTFRRQLAAGGPLTVTHPDVTRFFMTIPEAVQLVLQAAVLAEEPGETFVLDMGEPVRIADLARDLVELHGRELGEDIELVYTGLRAGEKLEEELFFPYEHPTRTIHEAILRVAGSAVPADFYAELDRLAEFAKRRDRGGLLAGLSRVVPEYSPPQGVRPSS